MDHHWFGFVMSSMKQASGRLKVLVLFQTLKNNKPKATFDGADAQLDAAIEHLEALIQADPRPVPQAHAYPDKSFKNGKSIN